MRVIEFEEDIIHIALSRKNLESLLLKLNGFPPDSARTITKILPEAILTITAEENDEHYTKTELSVPGLMHPATEEMLND